MTPENFLHWLNGFFELTLATTISTSQMVLIKEKLDLALKSSTTSRSYPGIPDVK